MLVYKFYIIYFHHLVEAPPENYDVKKYILYYRKREAYG